MDQESQDSEEGPSNYNLLKLIEKQQRVSLESFEKQEAFLVGRNLFNSSVEKFQIGAVTDVGICKELFEKFSPKQSLFDLWDFRYAWYLGYHHHLCFFVLYYENKPVGLLPLWYENDKKIFSWFGSYWMEDNTFWVFKKEYIPLILSLCPERTFLNAVLLDEALSNFLKLEHDEPKYILDLTNISSYENFLATLKCKQRKKLKRDLRIINNQNPKIIINRFSDIETSFDLCKKRFKQDSDCLDPRRREVFRQIIKQAKNYQIKMISVEINNQIATVVLVCLYKNTCYIMKEPKNVIQFPGIGTYINLFQIQDAINLGCKKIDFLEGNYNWKNKFSTPVPLYCFRKELTKEEIIV